MQLTLESRDPNVGTSHASWTTATIEIEAPNAGSSRVSSSAATIELELAFPTESNSEKNLKIG